MTIREIADRIDMLLFMLEQEVRPGAPKNTRATAKIIGKVGELCLLSKSIGGPDYADDLQDLLKLQRKWEK